eukprot:Blabericola_migrator_1__10700@NODE_610_length_7290_cov_63_426554_g443_i0_p1_GENE_NODE_610_length_7290_cov_63_426554_g443_i0NODE_610_length_7290_cov_63_426554_g443_i0_p1_ORF_typecomplete_len545_score69_03_NODE_610_length_7290_cov_63_426554_g443_i017353369
MKWAHLLACWPTVSYASTGRHNHLLPGATVLTFDYTLPLLKNIDVTAVDHAYRQDYKNISIKYFRRIPVIIDLHNDDAGFWNATSSLLLQAKLTFLDDTDTVPTLLLHKKTFGGNSDIWYDTSNFCDWLAKHGNRRLKLPLNTDLAAEIKPDRQTGLRRGLSHGAYTLYVGFAGTSPEPRQVSFVIHISLESVPKSQTLVSAPCHALESSVPPHKVHANAIRSRLRNVVAKEILLRRWDMLEGNSLQEPRDPKLKASFSYNEDSLLLLGLGLPQLPRHNTSFEPILVFRGLRPHSGATILIGSYASRSIWEFQKVSLAPSSSGGDKSVALPLQKILTHLESHKSLIDPPGNILLLAILKHPHHHYHLKSTEEPAQIHRGTDDPDPSRMLADLVVSDSEGDKLAVYPAILNTTDTPQEPSSRSKSAKQPLEHTSKYAGYAERHMDIVRGSLLGAASLAGIMAFLYARQLVSTRVISASEYQDSSRRLDTFYARSDGTPQGSTPLREQNNRRQNEEDDDRTRLLDTKERSVAFDISSHGGDSHRKI